ncbi:MAG: ABC transporter permease, partial [Acidobacteriota bacterium]
QPRVRLGEVEYRSTMRDLPSLHLLGETRRRLRGLVRDPNFTVTAVLILALGAGAQTSMVTAVRGLLLEPLPYAEPEQLVSIYEQRRAGDRARRGVALDTLPTWRQVHGIEDLAGYRLRSFGVQSEGADGRRSAVEVAPVGLVTAGLFRTLGVGPELGRAFGDEEERAGLPVAVISDGLWRRAFDRDPDVLSRTILLNDEAHRVIGVLPEDFRFAIKGQVPEAYIPISHALYGGSRSKRALEVVGRLRAGVDLERLRTELDALGERLASDWPETHREMGIGVQTLDESLRGANRRPLAWLLGGATLLLLIACANVAGLMLARSLRRRRQRAIRAALGADGLRLAVPTLVEGALVGVAGGAAGLWVAALALDALPLALPALGGASPVAGFDLASLRLDPPSALLALVVALGCGALFGAWPAWRLRRRPPCRDLGTSRSPQAAMGRGLGATVVLQVAFGTLLLLATGLLGRSFVGLLNAPPGFDAAGVTSFGLGLPEARYDTDPAIIDFHRDLHRELADLLGVEAVGAAARRPLGDGFRTGFVREADGTAADRQTAAINVVSAGYFEALRIPLLAGRVPSWNADVDGPRVLVVNDAFRRAHLGAHLGARQGGVDDAKVTGALGERLRLTWWSETTARGTSWEIVGVVGDVHQRGLDQAPVPEIYLPMGQFPTEGATYLLRGDSGRVVSTAELSGVVHGLDPDLQKVSAGEARGWALESLADRQLALAVLAIFGLAALFTTAIGVYAQVATDVAARRGELAVRRALGARLGQVSATVVRRSLVLVSLGFALGALAFLAFAPGLEHLLFGVTTVDPVTFVGIWGLLATCALTAGAGPALRAAGRSVVDDLRG